MCKHMLQVFDMSCDLPTRVLLPQEQKAPFNCGCAHPLSPLSVGEVYEGLYQTGCDFVGMCKHVYKASGLGCDLRDAPTPLQEQKAPFSSAFATQKCTSQYGEHELDVAKCNAALWACANICNTHSHRVAPFNSRPSCRKKKKRPSTASARLTVDLVSGRGAGCPYPKRTKRLGRVLHMRIHIPLQLRRSIPSLALTGIKNALELRVLRLAQPQKVQ